MGWVKLDDGFPHHPKVVALSDAAFRAYIDALCYAATYETDGIVPNAVAANGSVRRELAEAGLWEILENSISVHDYLVYNPSRDDRERDREAARLRQQKWRNAVTNDTPVPVPHPKNRKNLGRQAADFDAFWSAYPRKVGKRTARAAYERALKRADADTIRAGAERYRDDPNRSDEFTAHPTTWLNRDGWGDDPEPTRGANPAAEAAAREHERKVAEAKRIAREGV